MPSLRSPHESRVHVCRRSPIGQRALAAAALIGLIAPALADEPVAPEEMCFQGRTAEAWSQDLASKDRVTRLLAIRALATFGDRATPHFIEALGHDDPSVRYWAAMSLAHDPHAAKKAQSELMVRLVNDDVGVVRVAAARGVAAAGDDEQAVRALIESLKSSEPMVRHHATLALDDLGEAARPAIPALQEVLKSDGWYAARVSEFILAKFTVPPSPAKAKRNKKKRG